MPSRGVFADLLDVAESRGIKGAELLRTEYRAVVRSFGDRGFSVSIRTLDSSPLYAYDEISRP